MFKTLAKTSLVYTLGSGGNALIAMAIFFVLARGLPPAGLGHIALFTSLIQLFAAVANAGMSSALSYYYYKHSDEAMRTRCIACAFWYNTSAAMAIAAVLLLFRDHVLVFLELSDSTSSYLYLLIGLFVLEVTFAFFVNLCRLRFESFTYVTSFLVRNALICLLLATGLIQNGRLSVTAFFTYTYIGILVPQLYLVFKNRRYLSPILFDSCLFGKMMEYGSPLLVGSAAVYFISYSDRLVIQKLSTTNELGYYFVAAKVAMMIGLVVQGFKSAWGPTMLRSALSENDTKMIPATLDYYVAVSLLAFILISGPAREIIFVLAGPQYERCAPVAVFLLSSVIFFGAYDIVHSGIVLSEKLILHSLIMVIAGATNLLLNVILVSLWGILGAAVATSVSWLLAAGLAFFCSQRYMPVSFNYRRLGLSLFLILAITVSMFLVATLPPVPRALACLLSGTAVLTAYRNELRSIRAALGRERTSG